MEQGSGRQLPDLIGALDAASGLTGGLNRRQQQRDQNPDDRDHHQQFDQGKTV